MSEGTVYDYWVSELARIPAYIQDSPYRDYLTRQIADEDQRRHAQRVHEQEETNEEHDDYGDDYVDGWADHLEATYDPDNERMEDTDQDDGWSATEIARGAPMSVSDADL